MTAPASKSSSTTRTTKSHASADRLSLIRAKAAERADAKAEREAMTAHLKAKAEAEDAEALGQCCVILDRMSRRAAEARAFRTVSVPAQARKRARMIRLAPITARDVEIETGTASVRDPYDSTSFLTATINRRVDILSTERTAGRITEAQFLVGRMIQAVYERGSGARLGSGGWGAGGSRDQTIAHELAIIYAVDDAHCVQKFTRKLQDAIGMVGVRFLRAILTEGQTFSSYAKARGKSTERDAGQVAAHFRHLLEGLTEAQHTARAPGPVRVQDGYARQADAVGDRLTRLRATAEAEKADAP